MAGQLVSAKSFCLQLCKFVHESQKYSKKNTPFCYTIKDLEVERGPSYGKNHFEAHANHFIRNMTRDA